MLLSVSKINNRTCLGSLASIVEADPSFRKPLSLHYCWLNVWDQTIAKEVSNWLTRLFLSLHLDRKSFGVIPGLIKLPACGNNLKSIHIFSLLILFITVWRTNTVNNINPLFSFVDISWESQWEYISSVFIIFIQKSTFIITFIIINSLQGNMMMT